MGIASAGQAYRYRRTPRAGHGTQRTRRSNSCTFSTDHPATMAGGHGGHNPVKLDTAVESWSYMRENLYKTFKFTPRTTSLSLIWGLAVPVALYYGIVGQDVRLSYTGRLRVKASDVADTTATSLSMLIVRPSHY